MHSNQDALSLSHLLANLPPNERRVWTQLLFETAGAQRVQRVFTDAQHMVPLVVKVRRW